MSFDAFLKIDGIDGESTDARHKDEIEISSYSWGVSNTGSHSFGGGGGAGKAAFQDLTLESRTQKSSPQVAQSCAAGTHIPKAVLTLRKAGGAGIEFVKVTMSDAIVSSYNQAGAAGGDQPADSFSLFFSKLEFDYYTQAADGSVASPTHMGWDLGQNKGV